MRNLLQILLIVFALALSALVAFQWHRENGLRQQVQSLTDELQKQRRAAATLSNSVAQANAELVHLNGLKNEFNDAMRNNQEEIARLKAQANPEQGNGYKKALDTANARIATQNDELRKLAADHNEVVLKFNKMADEYNELARKWNEQQEQAGKNSALPAGKQE